MSGRKPTVKLLGENSNAFVIIGLCMRAAKKSGWTEERCKEVRMEMMSGDYDKVLQTAMKYFNVK